MAENILEKIIENKKKKIDLLKKSVSLEILKLKINENKSFINFKQTIENNQSKNKISIILSALNFASSPTRFLKLSALTPKSFGSILISDILPFFN